MVDKNRPKMESKSFIIKIIRSDIVEKKYK